MAAQKITSFLTSEEIFDLGTRLRKLGFAVDTRHLIQAHQIQDLLFALQIDGSDVTIDRLKTILAPIFCSTPDEQTTFYALFDDWIERQSQILERLNLPIPPVQAEVPIRKQIKQIVDRSKNRWLIVSMVLVALSLLTIFIIIIFYQPELEIPIAVKRPIIRILDSETLQPVPNAQVIWSNDTLKTDNQGEVNFKKTFLDRDAKLIIRCPEYLTTPILFHSDGIKDTLVILIHKNKGIQQLRGLVKDAITNQPVPSARITFLKQEIITKKNGRFGIAYQPQDSAIVITCRHPDYSDATVPFQLHGYDKSQVNIALNPKPVAETDSLFALVERINAFARNEANQVKLKSWQKFVHQYFPLLRLTSVALPLIMFVAWLIIRWFRRRIILERLTTTRERKAESIAVKGKAEYLYRNSVFRRLVQRYRLHREEPSPELDVPATVEATIRQGGLFSPLFAVRNVLPEYLALIDRASFSDQHAAMLDSLIQRMRADGVIVDRYFFDADPRICQSDKPDVPQLTLPELLARHPQHRLLIFSDAVHFIDARSGKPRRYLEQFLAWPNPAIFIPDKTEGVAYLELSLKNLGFEVAPANLNGLSRHIDTIQLPIEPERVAWRQLHPFPELLDQRADIWLERQPPDADQIERLMEQLKGYLGADAMVWLCACAVYPELHWELTLYLATRLNLPQDTFPGDEDQLKLQRQLLDLTRLSWFRQGTMPDWLRLRLITELTPQQHKAVRQELKILLESARKEATDGFKLEFIRRTPADPLWDLKNRLFEKLGFYQESPLRDYIFSNYMSGGKPGLLTVLIPEKVRRYFFHSGQVMLGVRPLAVLLTFLVVSAISWLGISILKSSLPRPYFIPTFHIADDVLATVRSDSSIEYYVNGPIKPTTAFHFTQNFSRSFQDFNVWLPHRLKQEIQFNDSLYSFVADLPDSRFKIKFERVDVDSLKNTHLLLVERGQIFRSDSTELSENDVKLMLKKFKFYCEDYDWNKEYSNPEGTGFDNLFELSDDSLVVYDHASGLMWQQGGSHDWLFWSEVPAYIDSLNQIKFAGFDGWRLPTLEEAMSLMERNKSNNGLYISDLFDSRQRWIWTADPYAGASGRWVVSFYGGYCGPDSIYSYDLHVRAVRFGQLPGE